MAAEIDGEVAECRTRLTSRFPSADHKSTVSTKKEVSISLRSRVSIVFSGRPDGSELYLFVDHFFSFHAGAREIEGPGKRETKSATKKLGAFQLT